MERKQTISQKISSIIKESAVDCIQNTRDDVQLNEKCIRFPDSIQKEESHFPGISSSELNQIDIKQFESNFSYFIEPNLYVVSAKGEEPIFVYYELENVINQTDIRYIRENGKRVCDYYPNQEKLYYYESKEHPLNTELGSKFSVFQSVYQVPEYIITRKIQENIFPPPEEIMSNDNLSEHIIKYNVTEKMMYSPKQISTFIQLYDYNLVKQQEYSLEGLQKLILYKKKLFKTI
tara:strand:- start:155 stop:856 length:702 start_codon:yes stop_codon:yes gene_type:complete